MSDECSCCSTDATTTTTEATTSGNVVTDYTVTGMTCGHCVSSVTEEISKIDGVLGVNVNLESGAVTVTSDRDLSAADVASAVDEAGYTLA